MSSAHELPLAALEAGLGSSPCGLTEDEAARRLQDHGANELRVHQDTPEIVKFLLQFKNFFAVLLIVGGALAIVAEQLDSGQGNLYIAIALLGVVLLNATFTYVQQHRSERIMDSFRRMLPSLVAVVRNGQTRTAPAEELVPGDVILLHEGDRVPADGRLIEANKLVVDVSSLTGESEPQLLDPEARHENILDSRNMVFSGTLVHGGEGRVLVSETGMSTQIGSIVTLTKATEDTETPIHRELGYFIEVISAIAISLGILFFLVSVATGNSAITSLIFAIGIIVANVPEGLLPTVTLALSMASKRMAAKNALVKNLESVETLGSTTVICTDKTGTLTQNRLGVNTVVLGGREYAADDHSVTEDPVAEYALQCVALCNAAELTDDGFSGDATDGALLQYADELADLGTVRRGVDQLAEQPFDYATRRMIATCRAPEWTAPRAFVKGAPEVVLDMCDRIMFDGRTEPLTQRCRDTVMDSYEKLAGRGERGLAYAWRTTSDADLPEDGYLFIGLTGMTDTPRPEVAEAMAKCHEAGIKVVMITGDYGLTASTVARQIGLITGPGTIVQGNELSSMSDEALADILTTNEEIIFARIAPAQKLRVVQAFQALGETVTVTGDGVNDAPALKNADMGVAMGRTGTDVAKEASDMVLIDDNFATIVSAIEEGRTVFDNIKKFIAYILTSNIPEILPFVAYVLLDIPLPLTVVLILSIDLGTDILPALGLGVERPESDVMRKKPRPREERLLSRNLLLMSYGIVGMIQAAAGFFSYFVILRAGGWQWGQELAGDDPLYRTAVTGFFASIIICQIADVMICRTRRQSLLTVGPLSNKLVTVGIGTEILLLALISYVPAFNSFFGTAPLEPWQLALSVPFAAFILVADELRRVFVRRGNPFVLRWLTW